MAMIVTVLVALAAIGFGIRQSAAQADAKPAVQRPALTVTTARPETASLPLRLRANGNIVAWQEAIIGSEANGLRLKEVHVNVGDTVRAGQLLAEFAKETVQADVAQAEAALMEAKANAADAENNAARARTLQETGALSTQQINQYQTLDQTARAKVQAARATLAAQQLRLKQTRVIAPDDGIISARNATVGAVVGAGTELFRMVRKGRLEWRAEVTAEELGRLTSGMPVSVKAANGTVVPGKVRMIGPTVDEKNRSAIVYVDLQKAPADAAPIKAGMFANGEFDLGVSSGVTVPQQAVVIRDGFSYVFTVNADGRVTQARVRTGRRIGDRVEIAEGIGPEVTVAARGAAFLNDGDLVKIASASPAANAVPSPDNPVQPVR